jgi:hypothetical protein
MTTIRRARAALRRAFPQDSFGLIALDDSDTDLKLWHSPTGDEPFTRQDHLDALSRYEEELSHDWSVTLREDDPLPYLHLQPWYGLGPLQRSLFRTARPLLDAVHDAIPWDETSPEQDEAYMTTQAIEALGSRDLIPPGLFDYGQVRDFHGECDCSGGWIKPQDFSFDADDPAVPKETVARFQKAFNDALPAGARGRLMPDGIAGPVTRAALERYARERLGQDTRPCARCAGTGTAAWPAPRTRAQLERFVSDLPNALQAEALAQEVATRLAAWGTACAPRVRWVIYQRHRGSLPSGDTFRNVSASGPSEEWPLYRFLRKFAGEAPLSKLAAPGSPCPQAPFFPVDVMMADRMRLARSMGEPVPAAFRAPMRAQDRPEGDTVRTSDLPDPLDPLLRIYRLGYAVLSVQADAITLLAQPPSSGDGPGPASRALDKSSPRS